MSEHRPPTGRQVLLGVAMALAIGIGQLRFPTAMSRTWAQPPTATVTEHRVAVIVQAEPGSLAGVERAT